MLIVDMPIQKTKNFIQFKKESNTRIYDIHPVYTDIHTPEGTLVTLVTLATLATHPYH